jgi:hypothetical protein
LSNINYFVLGLLGAERCDSPPKYRVYKKNAISEFHKKSTLQFLSIKDFRPLGIEIELLIGHITAVVCRIK